MLKRFLSYYKPYKVLFIFDMLASLLVALIVFLTSTNKLLNALRMYNKNERLSSTDEGAELVRIRRSKKLYEELCK